VVRLNAIIERIDYLKWLVSGAVWLRPIYPSPFRDFGYDISDFCAVDPMYGTLADFDRLVERLHGSGMSLLLDFVPNHTSDTHPWFRESRASRDAPKRDWYVRADEPGWRATQQLAQPLRRQRLASTCDPERAPMRWTADEHGGFPTEQPWLPMGDDVAARNVQTAKPIPARCYAWVLSVAGSEELPLGAGLLSVDRARPQTAFERTQARRSGRSLPAEPVHGRRAGGGPLRQNPKNP
jgi:hypothetical protein